MNACAAKKKFTENYLLLSFDVTYFVSLLIIMEGCIV